MMEWLKKLGGRFSLRRDKTVRLLLWLGVAGIALITLTEWLPQKESDLSPITVTAVAEVTASQVEAALERRIGELLSAVEGVGRCRVLVTLESDTRSVYAADTVLSNSADGGSSSSETYLAVDTDSGPVGLLLTRVQPTVKGVAVVCQGGGDPAVCQRVQDVVSTAFHISERRVCVVKQQ